MSAKIVSDHSHDRTNLAKRLPLAQPLSVFLLVADTCNFKCNYCVYAKPNRKPTGMPRLMSVEKVKAFAQQAKAFPQKLNTVILAGYGEPTMNPDLGEIISILKQAEIAKEIAIVTNGYALTNKLSDQLIEGGLDLMRISIQGIDAQAYQDTCGVNIDFERLREQISYFYEHKTNTRVFIKVMEEQLRNEAEKEKFMQLFTPICDEIAIEHLAPLIPEISHDSNYTTTIRSDQLNEEVFACFRPFMSLLLLSDGRVASCCCDERYQIYGNFMERDVVSLWNGEERSYFLQKLLTQGRSAIPKCAECPVPKFEMRPEDDLDPYLEELREKFSCLVSTDSNSRVAITPPPPGGFF